jgi:hypothetical protein
MQRPYNINIFVADGTPDGLKIIEKTGMWSGRGVVFPRSSFPEVKSREEFQLPGVYILIGTDEDDSPTIYIGEGNPVKDRIESHYRSLDFWSWCVFFCSTNNGLNKAYIQYLEAVLITLAKDTKRVKLENNKVQNIPKLSEMEKAIVDDFLCHMLDIYPLLGLYAFDKPTEKVAKKQILYLSGPGADARGYESTKGFVVLKGSKAQKQIRPASVGMLQKKFDFFLNEGLFEDHGDSYILTQDFTFSSPSLAAAQFLARNANGRTEWKTKTGKTLKKIQEEKVDA